jgi:hypothetical protein
VESLEARVLLDASPDRLALSALVGDLAQFRSDATTSALTLVNRGQSSQPNSPMPADVMSQWATLTNDYNKTWQDIGHVQFAALEMAQEGFNTLLNGLGIGRPDQSESLSPTAASTSDPISTDPPVTASLTTGPSITVKTVKPLLSPPLPTVQFLQATSTVMEFPTANFFRVGLSAASSQTVTVQYTTSDGTAKAGTDYTATSGTLTFMPGTTQQNIRVNILDDNLVNEPSAETFTLTLSNPTNATLGSQTTDTVSIDEDNDGGSSSTLPPSVVGAPTCNDG